MSVGECHWLMWVRLDLWILNTRCCLYFCLLCLQYLSRCLLRMLDFLQFLLGFRLLHLDNWLTASIVDRLHVHLASLAAVDYIGNFGAFVRACIKQGPLRIYRAIVATNYGPQALDVSKQGAKGHGLRRFELDHAVIMLLAFER